MNRRDGYSQPSNMPAQKNFSVVPQAQIQRSVFNRSHARKQTFNSDQLVPILVDEVLPGDSFDLRANLFARLSSSMEFPIMDNLHLDTFFFFVPNRIIWDNWEKFMGAQDNPSDSTDFTVPTLSYDEAFSTGEITDFMGVPPNMYSAGNTFLSALPFRAYNLIWNEWFRDENLQDSVEVPKDNGPDAFDTYYGVLKRGKRHDYFTSCLPWPQKGDPVSIGLTGNAPVIGDGTGIGWDVGPTGGGNQYATMWRDGGGNELKTSAGSYGDPIGDTAVGSSHIRSGVVIGLTDDPDNSGVVADLSDVTAILVNDLRLAVATQQLLERDARGGTRYVELIKSHFGITVPDFRLQRPEYLGGGSHMVNVNPVTQTSTTVEGDATRTPAGNQTSFATMSNISGFSKSFNEHGFIIGLANVRADITYQQGLNRMFSRQTRYDFYFPAFAHLGEQAVLNKEINWQDDSTDENVFGYQERWAEYRYKPSEIAGQFRSSATETLDSWHLSEVQPAPLLGDDWIESNTPLDRVLATTNAPEILLDAWFEYKCARPMPLYSVPGLQRL